MFNSLERFIDRKIVMLKESTPISVAARAMTEQRVGSVVVCSDHGKLSGILSDRDIVCEIVANKFSYDATLASAMSPGLISVNENAEVDTVLNLMEEFGVRRIAIVSQTNGREKCVGIVTLDDLAAAKRIPLDVLARIVKRQMHRRNTSPSQALRREVQSEEQHEHTLNRFYKTIGEKCQLRKSDSVLIADLILTQIVERLSASGAVRLIAQLPKALQDKLLNLPAGPDRDIDSRSLVRVLHEITNLTDESCTQLVAQFWDGLQSFLNADNLDFVLLHLPQDLRDLFLGKLLKASDDNFIPARPSLSADGFADVIL